MQAGDLFSRGVPLCIAVIVLSACAAPGPDHPYLHKAEQPREAEWSYSGDTGPDHWGDLCAAYQIAKTGREQSPIDISDTTPGVLPPIEFDYHKAAIDLVYNGHTVEQVGSAASSITVEGAKYELAQFHFHSPSEHTIDGRHSPMEMHLVHKAADGSVAVVAVMIEEGAENSAFAPVWGDMPTDANRESIDTVTVDTAKLVPEDRGYFLYRGSFTTPPCTEQVRWMVLQSPVNLSAAQIEKFRAVIHGNNRPVRPLNGREVIGSR